jgi:Tol biopolymer transport system component
MKRPILTVAIGLVLMISLACEFITSQSQSSGTVEAETPESGVPSDEGVLSEATATLALEPTIVKGHGAGQIVFRECKSKSSMGTGTQCGIYIMDADGSNMRQLTDLDYDYSPALSPDGTQVAFYATSRDRDNEIYVINTDGSGLTRLTNREGEDTAPSWSPDGSRILYISSVFTTGAYLNIFVMDADGSNPHPLTNFTDTDGFSAGWSPDGSQIVFATVKNHVFHLNIMDADGSNAQVIKTDPAQEIGSPVWSPDGTKIAFLSRKSAGDPPELDVINIDGTDQRSLTAGFHVIYAGLSWSPDGQKLLFTMMGDGKSTEGNHQLYIVNVDGSDLHKLDVQCADCAAADWGP